MAIEFRGRGLAAVAVVLVSLTGCTVAREGSGSAAPEGRSETSSQVPGDSGGGGGAGDEWTPGPDNEDPSKDIDGVEITEYDAVHAQPGQRVAYKKAPPDGGRHDQVWATCNGVACGQPGTFLGTCRISLMDLGHGAVWA